MKTRIALLIAVLALVLLGGAALARSDPRAPIAESSAPTAPQTYHLTSQTWQISGITSGDGIYLASRAAPAGTGSGCCCTFLPFICNGGTAPPPPPPPGLDLTISDVKIIQGTSASSTYAVNIADRATTVRAFVAVTGASSASGVYARMYGYNAASALLGNIASNTITAPSDESSMAKTLNFNLPGSWLKPGYSFFIELNQDNTISENTSNNRYPASGTAPFNFVTASALNMVIVPVSYKPYGSSTTYTPQTSPLSYLTSIPIKVFPVPTVNYTLHAPYLYAPASAADNLNGANGWDTFLDQVTFLHNSEEPGVQTKVYFGLINYHDAHDCSSGCVSGIGWVGLPTSTGFSGVPNGASNASWNMTHEVGHNLNRRHTPCTGGEANPDPAYPYAGGKIGVWGLDVATGTLYSPSTYNDYMGYCGNQWTSDYTFQKIKQFRDTASFNASQMNQTLVQAMYVSGIIARTGTLTLSPVYQQLAAINLAREGSHTLELLGQTGQVLATHPFTPTPIADSGGSSGFGFFVPVVDGLAGIRVRANGRVVAEKIVSAPLSTTDFTRQPIAAQPAAQGTVLRWTPVTHPSESIVYRVRLSRDAGATWQVLALNWRGAEFTAPAGVDVNDTLLEVQASDGIHTTTRTFTLGRVR